MGCPQVEKLRQDASKVYLQLKEKLKKARELGRETAPGNVAGTDYEPLLRRKLRILSGEIDRHLTYHGCESGDRQ